MLIESNDWKKSFENGSQHLLLGWFTIRTGTSVDNDARKSNNLLDQCQSDKLGTESRVESFPSAFPFCCWISLYLDDNSGTRCREGCLDSVNGHTSTNPSTTTFISVWTYTGVRAIRVDTECKGVALETAVRTLIYVCKQFKQMDKQKFLKIPQKKRILFTLLQRTSLNFKPSFRNCKHRVYMYTCNCDISSFIYIYIPQFLHVNWFSHIQYFDCNNSFAMVTIPLQFLSCGS